AVPHGPDRVEHHTALLLIARAEQHVHADAEVEPLEQDVAGPQQRDRDEPDDGERIHFHISCSAQYAKASTSSRSPMSSPPPASASSCTPNRSGMTPATPARTKRAMRATSTIM